MSIITPPKVSASKARSTDLCIEGLWNRIKITLGILEEAKALGIPALWLQPGAEDDAVKQYVNDNLSDKVIFGGPCILVSGDRVIESLNK